MTVDRVTRSCSRPSRSGRWRRSAETKELGTSCTAVPRLNVGSCAQDATSIPLTTWRRFGMKLEQSFEVSAPVEQVWRALIDIERVAPCLPGGSITGGNEDASYNGAFTIKIGPTTASYTGKLEMKEVDETAHAATMLANGSDRRGQGGAHAPNNSKLP